MNIIADTNILITVALNEPEKDKINELTVDCFLHAPNSIYFEVGNALSSLAKRNLLTEIEAMQAWDIIQNIPINLYDINIKSALKTAAKHKRYAYDCYFIELAQKKNFPILTMDKGLISFARELKLKIIEV